MKRTMTGPGYETLRLIGRAVRSRSRRAWTAMIGIGVATVLVLVLASTYRSVSAGIVAYTGQPSVDLWVAPAGTDNLVRSSGVLRDEVVGKIAALDGVEEASAILRSFVTAESSSERITLLAIGYAGPDGPGGPPEVVRGRTPERLDEMTLDRSSAYRLDVDVRDRITINGKEVTVVGITRQTNLMATQLAFLDASRAATTSGFEDRVSFVVVRLSQGADPAVVSQRIHGAFDGVQVFGREEFVENNLAEVTAGFQPIQVVISLVGLLAAIVVVVLVVQSAVEDREREIAVLLALGASHSAVTFTIVRHVALLVAVGSGFGGVAAHALAANLDRWLPLVEMRPSVTDALVAFAVFGVVGVVASLGPTRRLKDIDPVEAFRP